MNASFRYYHRVTEILSEVFDKEAAAMEEAARAIADANRAGHSVFAFGCNHAGLITLELFYRTGGMVTVNPVRAPGMMLELSPPTMTSEMERIPGYGRIIFGNMKAKEGDVLIILEAMKMENEVVATRSGTVAQIVVNTGAVVETGSPLVVIA